jgi:hypothetical protein
MSLDQPVAPTAQVARHRDHGRHTETAPGWWQASDGLWCAPVTGMSCGNGHLMDEGRAFCRACGAPRGEFAIESTSSLDPAATAADADGATEENPNPPHVLGNGLRKVDGLIYPSQGGPL